ncbi:MAG: hypothetical protein HY911_06785 [Desulfobacterales bacterium]|nr:hypothetical protein [Desulfobacterales bacterium]
MAHAIGTSSSAIQSLNIFGQPLTIFGVPVDREKIFTNHKGVYQKQVEKRQRKLIVKSTFIKFFLHHGEQIRCLTTGYSPTSVLERMVTGPAFLFFKRALLIFTDKRILHVPTHFDRSARSAVSQIMYDDCAHLSIRGRSLHVKYKNGQEEIFPYLGRKEKRKIQALLQSLPATPKEAGRLKGRVFLCPSCTHELPAEGHRCETCTLAFKSTLQAKLRSALIPGGGYFYSRYPALGTMVALLELGLMFFVVHMAMALYQGSSLSLSVLAVGAGALILEKLVAILHAQELTKEYVPEDKDFAVRKI